MKPGKWLRRTLPLLFIAAALFTVFLFAGYTQPRYSELYLTPRLSDANGWELYRMEEGQKIPLTPEELSESQGTVYLTRILNPEWEQAGYTYLKLDGTMWQTAVYLDGGLLYSVVPGMAHTPEEAAFPEKYTGLSGQGESVRVTLPAGWGGKTLIIAGKRGERSHMPMVILSSGEMEQETTVTAANKIGMNAAAFAVAALLLLGLFLFGGWQKRWDWPLLLLAMAAFGQALYWLREYSMVFNVDFALNIPLAAFFPHLFVLLPQIYLTAQMTGRRRKLCALTVGIFGAVSLFSVVLANLPRPAWLIDSQPMAGLYVGTLAIFIFGGLEEKNGSRVFRLFFCGLALLLGAFLLCVAGSLLLGDGVFAGNVATAFKMAGSGYHYDLLRWIGQMLFLLCALLGVVETVWRTAETRTQVELLSSRNELAQKNLRILQESSAALSKARHEMMSHLNTLQALTEEKEYARMEEYLEQVTRQVRTIPPLKITGHPVVNTILLQYAQRAKAAGTRFECHVELPDALPVPDSDLSSLLTNLLSNALKAAQGKDSWIEVTIHIRWKYLFIECKNSYSGDLTRDGDTGLYRSDRGAGHGWGMKVMEDIAHRYQSELQAEGKDGVFLVRTALFLPKK